MDIKRRQRKFSVEERQDRKRQLMGELAALESIVEHYRVCIAAIKSKQLRLKEMYRQGKEIRI